MLDVFEPFKRRIFQIIANEVNEELRNGCYQVVIMRPEALMADRVCTL